MYYGAGDSGSAEFVNNLFGREPVFGGVAGHIRCWGSGEGAIDLDIRYNLFADGPGVAGLIDCPAALGEGNLVGVDPMYCDMETCGDLRLHPDSPAIGAGEGGVTIGAQEVGCEDAVSVVATAPAGVPVPSVWPNPSRGSFRVRFAHLSATAATVAVVYDAGGRVVAQPDAANGEVVWAPDGSVPPGVYFIRLRDPLSGEVRSARMLRIE